MNEKIGPILRQAREAKDLSLERVAIETHMREHYLRALEVGNFEALPSEAQARGFLRAYAEYLDIDLNDLPSEPDVKSKTANLPPPPPPPIVEDKPAGDTQASEIFQDVGRRLREQRELLGLSLEDIERHTHLRDRYLIALESGDLEKLPSPVQGRGMLNNYAIFLGLDPEPLLLRFAEGLQARLSASQARQPQDQTKRRSRTRLPAPLRRLLSGDILIGGTLAILLVIFMFWGAIWIFAIQTDQAPTITAPSIAEVLLASATPSPTPTSLPETPTPPPSGALFPTQAIGTNVFSGDPFPQNAEGEVQIYLTVYQRSWIKVVVDDEQQFDGRVIPGSAYAFSGLSRVEIITGNGAGINVFFNEQNLGPMGAFGQVVHNIYTVDGVLAPTATITPTPTETRPASPTPLPSATPRPGEATVPSNP